MTKVLLFAGTTEGREIAEGCRGKRRILRQFAEGCRGKRSILRQKGEGC